MVCEQEHGHVRLPRTLCALGRPTLCDAMDCCLSGSSVHRILQARRLEWASISFSRGSSQSRDRTRASCTSCVGRWVPYHRRSNSARSPGRPLLKQNTRASSGSICQVLGPLSTHTHTRSRLVEKQLVKEGSLGCLLRAHTHTHTRSCLVEKQLVREGSLGCLPRAHTHTHTHSRLVEKQLVRGAASGASCEAGAPSGLAT